MTTLVPADEIESIVGAKRHPHLHLGTARSEDGQFYILHSKECKDSGIDLTECEYSILLDEYGVDFWEVDAPLVVHIVSSDGELYTESLEDYDE